MRRSLPSLALLLLVGCADGATDPTTSGNAAIRAALLIDPENLPRYAGVALPAHYDAVVLGREDRTIGAPITDAGATLGRVLFYERQLSRSGTVSCASCHAQTVAFGDSAQFSRGFEGALTAAHSMRLVNARFNENGRFFWDRRAATLEAQSTQPIQDPGEMGFDAAHGGITAALARLRERPYYAPLFRMAFGDSVITEDRVQRALAQYVRSIVSTTSRWDLAAAPVFTVNNPQGSLNGPFPTLTPEENQGKQLFQGSGCAACHVPPSFSLNANSRSNGLDAGETRIFRSPSLKQVGRSGRFMHDGRFATLEQVVDFYNEGIQAGPALDNRLMAPPLVPGGPPSGIPRRFGFTAAQKAALVAFLRTLTDEALAADPRFSDPFRR
ncbi:MAG: cytochrome-c peroxidase [Gemmatimonadaceae bacterium]|jgi:cytochrome c peroxidase